MTTLKEAQSMLNRLLRLIEDKRNLAEEVASGTDETGRYSYPVATTGQLKSLSKYERDIRAQKKAIIAQMMK
jgi:hypothetical protein